MTIKTKFNVGDTVDWTCHCIRKAIVGAISIMVMVNDTDISYIIDNKRYDEDDLYTTAQDAVAPLLDEDKIKFVG